MKTKIEIKKALEVCASESGCEECPYYPENECRSVMNSDIITALKYAEQNDDQSYKADAGKPRLSLVPLECLEPMARVREFAAQKYGKDGIEAWRNISDDRLLDALLRHLVAYQRDPHGVDEESGLPIIYHVYANAMFLAIKEAQRE